MESESEPASDWLPEPPEVSGAEQRAPSTPYLKIVVVYLSVLVMGMGLAWAFLSMRAVAGVGGSCASGGAYDIATPCPDGSWLISIAIPAMLIATFVGSGVGMSIGAPALLLPMWGLLFGSLGWNFLEFGFDDGAGGTNIAFIICGVMFWAMALPAWVAMGAAVRKNVRKTLKLERPARVPEKVAKERAKLWAGGALEGSSWWWLIYAVLYAGGALFGVAIYAAAA